MKKYIQPPFKRFVKLESGKILELKWRTPEPSDFDKKGNPISWEVIYDDVFCGVDGKPIGIATYCDVIVATADTEDELK